MTESLNKIWQNFLSFFFVLASVSANTCVAQNRVEAASGKTDILVSKYLAKENIPGASLTVSLNDTVIFSKGYGYADIGKKTVAEPGKTKFKIASIAKTITASAILKLEELGKIDTAKSVHYYLDSQESKKIDFSILQAGGHSAGLRRCPSAAEYASKNPYKKKDFYRL